MGAGLKTGCCGKRDLNLPVCRNERLSAHLDQLAAGDKEFESAWVYREEDDPVISGNDKTPHVVRIPQDRYTVYYQRNERHPDGNQWVRLYLRIDWGKDGLSFSEEEKKLTQEFLVRSKDLEPPLHPAELKRELDQVAFRTYDHNVWTSYDFCHYLFDQAPGKGYEYR
eukprot:gnl/TRDRNA2_/TRDRNA2_152055_c0_seq1.p1 gnl/TRDRNA2_/TRDRNA2_152055_c0~~gnl/TRDRNA2_/TRDRNA2_152055_c0_seq1.p1  ORF type:complete len:168 (-),score=33.94 gnl/TRDRNA2_/TRDRNA2_152055_c0_seq1:220-723(-)